MCVFGAFIYDAIADGKNRFIFKNFKESEFLISGLNFMGGSQFEIKKIGGKIRKKKAKNKRQNKRETRQQTHTFYHIFITFLTQNKTKKNDFRPSTRGTGFKSILEHGTKNTLRFNFKEERGRRLKTKPKKERKRTNEKNAIS